MLPTCGCIGNDHQPQLESDEVSTIHEFEISKSNLTLAIRSSQYAIYNCPCAIGHLPLSTFFRCISISINVNFKQTNRQMSSHTDT